MKRFLPQEDKLADHINRQAGILHKQLQALPVENLGMPHHCLHYFRSSHQSRLFFSIETSAALLYRSISMLGKSPADLVIMDYGAGVGTLYLLGKMIGCKKMIYNDFLSDWQVSAKKIADALNIEIDEYIVGDIDATIRALQEKQISCDIILSRNVIEHIYKLDDFYASIHSGQPRALVYSSTTANYFNPATHLQHVRWHRKWEKVYYVQRLELIKQQLTWIDESELTLLATATRGLAGTDLQDAIDKYDHTKFLPDPNEHYTNTCTPDQGIWVEHLLTFKEYRKLIGRTNYAVTFLPGFWDTNYQARWKNVFARLFNAIIKLVGRAGFLLAPFIYVIAEPIERKS